MADDNTGDFGRDVVEVNVGFDGEAGRKTTKVAAVAVLREFESLDVLTVELPREKPGVLENHPEIRYVETNGQAGANND